jgi:hypothetical protein
VAGIELLKVLLENAHSRRKILLHDAQALPHYLDVALLDIAVVLW